MQLGGRNAHLRAEPQLSAVVEASGRVDDDAARVHFCQKAIGVIEAIGANGLGVIRAVSLDVRQRRLEVVHDPDGEDFVEELGAKVRLRRGFRPRHEGACSLAGPELHAFGDQGTPELGQEPFGRALMDEQALERIADPRPLHLRVQGERAGHVEFGALVEEQVADALVVLDHRHPGHLGHEADQALTAARNGQIDDLSQGHELTDLFAIAGRHEAHRVFGQVGVGQRSAHDLDQQCVGARCLFTAPEQHGVAALEGERSRVDGHVGARLVHDGDQPDGQALLADQEPIRRAVHGAAAAHRIGQRGHLLHRTGQRLDLLAAQREAVEQGR